MCNPWSCRIFSFAAFEVVWEACSKTERMDSDVRGSKDMTMRWSCDLCTRLDTRKNRRPLHHLVIWWGSGVNNPGYSIITEVCFSMLWTLSQRCKNLAKNFLVEFSFELGKFQCFGCPMITWVCWILNLFACKYFFFSFQCFEPLTMGI